MTAEDVERIVSMEDPDNPQNLVVRHRGKIESVINNAICIQQLIAESKESGEGTQEDVFDSFLWSFVDDKPVLNMRWKVGGGLTDALTQSPESIALSKALKKKGFRFVGPTTCYAMMQATGMVLDHPVGSPEWEAARARLENRPGGYQQNT